MSSYRFNFRLAFAVGLGLWCTALLQAQVSDQAVGVPVRLWGHAIYQNYAGEYPEFMLSMPVMNGYYDKDWTQSQVQARMPMPDDISTVELMPGKVYSMSVTGISVGQISLFAAAPPGYITEIAGVPRTSYSFNGGGFYTGTVTFRIIAANELSDRAGQCSSLEGGKIFWQVALGSLRNGSSAGALTLADTGTGSDFSNVATPAALHYIARASEILVYRGSGSSAIRQIVANQAIVDIQPINSTSFTIAFYSPDQKIGSSAPYTFSGSPYVTYTVAQTATTTLQITSTTSARTAVTSVQRSGDGINPGYSWNVQDWNTSGQPQLVEEQRDSTGTYANRSETRLVRKPNETGVSPAITATKAYQMFGWGEELTQLTRGTSNPVTIAFDYYTDSTQQGNFAFVKSKTMNSGSWEAYDYDNTSPSAIGVVKTIYRPFNDSPATPSFDSNVGEVTSIQYTTDAFGMLTRPTTVQTSVNGVVTAKSVTSYSDTLYPGSNTLYIVTSTRNHYYSSGATVQSTIKYFREDAGAYVNMTTGATNPTEDFYRGLIYSITASSGGKRSYAYSRGTYDENTHGFTADSSGSASRVAVITGSATTGTPLSSYDGFTIDPVYLIDGRSTLHVTIRDARALVRRNATYVWNESTANWQFITAADLSYDGAGLLTSTTESNGATTTTTYSGEFVQSSIDPTGLQSAYTYDAAGRVATVTNPAVGVIGALVTQYTYNAASRPLQQVVGAGQAETLVTSTSYDDADRLVTETEPGPNGGLTTTYAYSPAARQVVITLPSGATRIEAYRADGILSQVTGTGIIPEYYTRDILADGTTYARVNIGSSTDVRKVERWTDWIGRHMKTQKPGFTGQPAIVQQSFYDTSTGLQTRSSLADVYGNKLMADTLYAYDGLGRLARSGVSIDGGGTALSVASNDRISDTDTFFESFNGAWWVTTERKVYAVANSSNPTTVSKTRERLSNFSATLSGFTGVLQAEELITDIDGNTTSVQRFVDRSTNTVKIATTKTGYANSQIQTLIAGLETSLQQFAGLVYTTGYDSLLRAATHTDPRTGTANTYYKSGSGYIWYIRDAAGINVVTYQYDAAGRMVCETDATGKNTRREYNSLNQIVHEWGDAGYPVAFQYNGYGERVAMTTYRGGSGWNGTTWPSSTTGTGDTTAWSYDSPSGLLAFKTDASAHAVSYNYNVRGQVQQRTSARGATKTYGYDGSTGELLTESYSAGSGTPNLSYTYGRAGQLTSVTDATGTRSLVYNGVNPLQLDAIDLSGFYNSRVLSRQYDAIHRGAGFLLGLAGNLSADISQTYAYNSIGRFDHLDSTSSAQASRTFNYGYNSGGLVSALTVASSPFSVTRAYEPSRDLLTSIDSQWSGASQTRFDYTYNALAQRVTTKQSGAGFGDFGGSTYYRHLYNDRGELTDSADYLGEDPTRTDSPQLSGRHFVFGYDSIGNRLSASRTGTAGAADAYTPNALNQYTSRTNSYAHAAGTVQTASSISIAGGSSTTPIARQGRYWDAQATLANANGPAKADLTVTATLAGSPSLVHTETRTAYLAASLQNFSYDADGNLTSDGVWNYTYDAENRLVTATTTAAAAGAGFPNQALTFTYDYADRRVQKVVANWNGASYAFSYARRFLYDGDNLVAEFDAPNGSSCGNVVRSYTWGLDVSGSLGAMGGVGALLQITDHGTSTSYFPTYDGNGNIASLLRASDGAIVAKYEYSPFGELLRCSGTYAQTNPFRFSTKYIDDETGLVYYGARYYAPTLGRFVNQDPIEEAGGLNLYGFCENDALNTVDVLGFNPGDSDDPVMLDRFVVNGTSLAGLTGNGGIHTQGAIVHIGKERNSQQYLAKVYPKNIIVSPGDKRWRPLIDLSHDIWETVGLVNVEELVPLPDTSSMSPFYVVGSRYHAPQLNARLTFGEFVRSLGSGLNEGLNDVAKAFRALPESIGGLLGAASVDPIGTYLEIGEHLDNTFVEGYRLAKETTLGDLRRDAVTALGLYVNDRQARQSVTNALAGSGTLIALGGAIGNMRTTGAPEEVNVDPKAPTQDVNGNSSASTKPQHGYEIYKTADGDVVKTGVSGQPKNVNGTSPRANRQVNKFNRTEGEGTYDARVVVEKPDRVSILEWEKENAERLRQAGNSMEKHKRP